MAAAETPTTHQAARGAGNGATVGETGIAAVRCLSGEQVWEAIDAGELDRDLLDAAISRVKRPIRKGKTLRELSKTPALFQMFFAYGLKVSVLTCDNVLVEWAAAWRSKPGGEIHSTLFYTQEARPFQHFTYLLRGVEQMIHSGKPSWPVERTLMTSGALDALLISKLQGGKRLETPYLKFAYESEFDWRQPPPPPPDRPIPGQ